MSTNTTDLPVTDAEIDADPAVAELETRIADGDTNVTAAQLADERGAAAGRVRFARLRQVAADRRARKDAEQVERDQAAAAEVHAREVLAPYTPAALVPLYDAAVAGLRAYTDALTARNDAIEALAVLPEEHRHRDLTIDHRIGPRSARVKVDGHEFVCQDISAHVERVLSATLVVRFGDSYRIVDPTVYGVDPRDPVIVAEGRAQLDDAGNAA